MINLSLAPAVHHRKRRQIPDDHVGHIRQIETMHDLFAGRYDSVTTVGEAFAGAVVGLGVAEAVNGEIVHVDGTTWWIPADGVPHVAPPELGMPFAVAAFGGSSITREVPEGTGTTELTALVDEVLTAENLHHEWVMHLAHGVHNGELPKELTKPERHGRRALCRSCITAENR